MRREYGLRCLFECVGVRGDSIGQFGAVGSKFCVFLEFRGFVCAVGISGSCLAQNFRIVAVQVWLAGFCVAVGVRGLMSMIFNDFVVRVRIFGGFGLSGLKTVFSQVLTGFERALRE